MIKPLEAHIGYGFTSFTTDEALATKYKHQQVGRYHNYFFTPENYAWPKTIQKLTGTFDGFAPNLNKQLHIGHLRNFCVAQAVHKITGLMPVSMIGVAVGSREGAEEAFCKLCADHNYPVKYYKDNELPAPTLEFYNGQGDKAGTKVWGLQNTVVIKSDGTPTYAYYDLAFAEHISPDYYITGEEQTNHFLSLGLGNKHLPMGLVLGEDGTKIKSRTGESLLLTEALQLVKDNLKPTPYPDELAWNIVCANFLGVGRKTNIKFIPETWANPDMSPGMYISYTYAKMKSALEHAPKADPNIMQDQIPLLSMAEYSTHAQQLAIDKLDPSAVVIHANKLATILSVHYNHNRIKDGDPKMVFAFQKATDKLEELMLMIGMHPLTNI